MRLSWKEERLLLMWLGQEKKDRDLTTEAEVPEETTEDQEGEAIANS